MVNEVIPSTEQKILDAAQLEFAEKGLDGARMQSIADRAGINKALLHYYYRSKEKLFEVAFQILFKTVVPKFSRIITSEMDLFEKIRLFVFEYISTVQKMPHIPGFILHEISSNPQRLAGMILNSGVDFNLEFLRKELDQAIALGRIRPIELEQLLINIISLSIFPIVAKPLIKAILFHDSEKDYAELIEKRKIAVADFIIYSIKNPNYVEPQK